MLEVSEVRVNGQQCPNFNANVVSGLSTNARLLIKVGMVAPQNLMASLKRTSKAVGVDETPKITFRESSCNATLGSCLFIAAAGYDKKGAFKGGFAAHLGSSTKGLIKTELDNLKELFPSSKINVALAGMSQRSNRSTLEKDCGIILKAFEGVGIPYQLRWEADDRPVFFDPESGNIISDIGLDFIPKFGTISEHQSLGRWAHLLLDSENFLLSSITYRGSIQNIERISFITPTVGLIEFNFSREKQ